MHVILEHESRWVCPNCTETLLSKNPDVRHQPFHPCKGLKGLMAPFVPEGMDCKVEAREREDYLSGEDVRTDGDGTPMMSVVTTRADGSNDAAVFAPTARVGIDA